MTSKFPIEIGWQAARACLAFAVFVLNALTIVPAFAQTSGSWNVDASSTWSGSSNWLNGIIADGSNGVANFTNNITATTTVTLDSPRTVGSLNFSDGGGNGSAWIVSGSDILTLSASVTPSIFTATSTTISVQLAGTGGFTKLGSQVLILTAANAYSGVTSIAAGTLRAVDGVGLSMGSNLSLAGGVLESSGIFSRGLGTGAGQVRWTNSGGFSAQGGNLAVQLNGNTNVVTWGSGGFITTGSLILGSATADALVDLQNAIDLGGTARIVSVTDNTSTTADLAQLSGVLSNGVLIKSGSGTLLLTGANTYSGGTSISSGALRTVDGVGLPAGSRLSLDGGVLESSGSFSRSLGASAGQVQWTFSGGFAAQGGNLIVQLNGSNNAVTWGSGSFVPAGLSLILGSVTADALVDFQNAIDLGGATRTISVTDNSSATADLAQLSGAISNGGLSKTGSGTLLLTGANTFSGGTTITSGTLQLSGGDNRLSNFGNITVNGGTLDLGGTNQAAGTVQLLSGTITGGGTLTGTTYDLQSGTISSNLGGTNGIAKTGTGTVILTGANTYSGVTTISAGTLRAVDGVGLSTGSNLALAGGVLESSGMFSRSLGTGAGQVQWTTDGGFSAQGSSLVVQLNGNSNAVTWGSGSFVPDGSPLLFGSGTATASVDFQNAIDLGGATRTVNVTANNLVFAQFSGVIANGGLTKTGSQILVLTAANTYNGVTTISAGTLRAVDSVGLPTASNLTLSGGVLESSGTFSRSLGTGAGQVQWTASSGFSAQQSNLVVQLNGNINAVTWGSGNFVPDGASLVFGSGTANALVDFQNAIDLGGATRTVSATAISGAPAQLSGLLSNGGLTKIGSGTLVLTGTNTYSGVTTISVGTLRAADGVGLSTVSNLSLAGGVLESSGIFSRSLGTGAGQVQWTAGGGFSAQADNLSVQLNGDTNAVTWGSGNFVPIGSSLLFGSTNSNALVDFQNAIDLGGATRTVSVTNNVGTAADLGQLSGVLSNGGLTKAGSGTLVLTGANTYSGVTTISSGALRTADGLGLPTASNLTLNFGVLESSGTFSRSLGSSAGQVRWTGSGGFSAESGNLLVQLNGNTNAVTWGSGSFVPEGSFLFLGSVTANALVDFQNGIDLGGATRTISAAENPSSTSDFAQLSGVLSNGGLTKSGSGTLVLTAANAYSGDTTILAGGALRAADGIGLPTGSNLTFGGGVLESSGTFSRNLGTGAGQVQWTGNGGFSAQGGDLVVQLNGSANVVTWGSSNFVPDGSSLVLSSLTADALVDFKNAIDLGGLTRTVTVNNNTNSTTDFAQLSGALSNGGLTKAGSGTLVLTGTNTYSGVTTIGSGGALRAIDGVGLPTGSNLTLAGGVLESNGTFSRSLGTAAGQVQWTGVGGFAALGGNLLVQLNGDTNAVTWGSGNFVLTGSSLLFGSTYSNALVDFQNAIELGGVTRTVSVTDNGSSGADLAQLSGLLSNGGLTKAGTGTLVLAANNTFSGATTIMGGALRAVDGVGLPTGSNLTLAGGVLESSGAFTRSLGTSADQVQWTASAGFAAQQSNLLVQLNGNTNVITWGSENFIPAGSSLVLSSVTADALVAFQNAIDLGGATRNIFVRDNAGSSTDLAQLSGVLSNGGLTKSGPGTLVLSADNTYSGTTDVTAGTLSVTGSTGSGKTTVATSGLLNGTGTVAGTLEVSSGGTLSAGLGSGVLGNGVGRLNSTAAGGTAVEWKTDANLVFDFAAANTSTAAESTPGTNWDYLSIAGVLDLQSGLGKINLYINSWNGTTGYGQNSNGQPADNFDQNNPAVGGNVQGRDYSYVWLWATTGGTIKVDGIDIAGATDLSNQFNVITDQTSASYGNGVFSGTPSYAPNSLGGQFWVSASGNKLFINYSSVPEPSSLLLIGAAGFGLGVYRRRKNRQTAEAPG